MSYVPDKALGRASPSAPTIRRLDRAASVVRFDPWLLFAFLYPLTMLVQFELVGQLFAMDVLAVPLFFALLLLRDARERLAWIWPFFALLGFWLAGQVATDLVRDARPEDFLRGWAKIVFFGFHVGVLWLWLPRRRAYLAAFAISLGIAAAFTIPLQFVDDPWKFGYDRALIYTTLGGLFFATLAFPRMRLLAPALMLGVALFLLFQTARSAFGTVFLAAIIVAVSLYFGNLVMWQKKFSGRLLALIVAGGLAVGLGATTIYGSAAESGWLGREAYAKYRDQTSGEVPLILGGRTESLVSIRAIGDAPVIGHGSWARDKRYVQMHHAEKVRYGLPIFDAERGQRDLIPTHSYLLGSWVEAGIAGGIFWLWVLTLPVLALLSVLKREEPLLPLVAYSAVALVWSTLFSPFGSSERFFVAFQLVLLFWCIGAHVRPIAWFRLRERKTDRAPGRGQPSPAAVLPDHETR